MPFTFRKQERLSKEKWIQELFERGSSFHLYPFKVLFLPHPDTAGLVNQVLISVSKRNFKRAVDRNALKRRLREAYRLNKHILNSTGKWLIAYIYVAKEILPSTVIHEKLALALKQISGKAHEKI